MQLWIIQNELKGGREERRDWKWQPLKRRESGGTVRKANPPPPKNRGESTERNPRRRKN